MAIKLIFDKIKKDEKYTLFGYNAVVIRRKSRDFSEENIAHIFRV
jgi:hypothetical protein